MTESESTATRSASDGAGVRRPLLRPGHNCWRIAPAAQVAFLVDAAAYYRACLAALRGARHRVMIIGWGTDPDVELDRDRPDDPDGGNDETSTRLNALLGTLVDRRPELEVHVLTWDFGLAYDPFTKWLGRYESRWETHDRLEVRLDDDHPVGGCHHQKIVVIDDAIAFTGGLDLTKGRWDTPMHDPDDPRRDTSDGRPMRPYHDVQVAVSGDAAAMLGVLARERWERATGDRLPDPPHDPADRWPRDLTADLSDVPVAIARTEPARGGRGEVREIEQLYLDAIARAREVIYIENQYFTSRSIGAALERRSG